MITLLYTAGSVGPVCQRVAEQDSGEFRVVRDHEPATHHEVLVRWGSRSTRHTGAVEINSADAVGMARDKAGSRRVLGTLAPRTWTYVNRREITYPCVVRPRLHHAGNRFFVCQDLEDRRDASRMCRAGWYASELVDKAREFRVFVVHGKVVCVSERFPAEPTDVAWNLAMGGRLLNVEKAEWPKAATDVATAGAHVLGLDWAAMDVCIARNGRAYVFEANTAPGLRNPYTLKKVAKALVAAAKAGPRWEEGYEIV